MIWNVEGADAKTGAERVISVTADSAAEAERRASEQGLLVSAVFPSTIVEAQRFDVARAAVAAAVEPVVALPPTPAASVPTVPYKSLYTKSPSASKPPWKIPWPQWLWAWETPPYFHLKAASIVLGVLAALSYAGGLISVVVGAYRFLRDLNQSESFFAALYDFLALASPVMLAALLHAAAAGCDALRDIAMRVRFGEEQSTRVGSASADGFPPDERKPVR